MDKQFEWVDPAVVCVGKAWHQFPNSFFLPKNFTLEFVQSEFKGQLPGKFTQWPHGLSDIPADFNDDNREVRKTYTWGWSNRDRLNRDKIVLIDAQLTTFFIISEKGLISRGGFFMGNPNPTKKIPILGILFSL